MSDKNHLDIKLEELKKDCEELPRDILILRLIRYFTEIYHLRYELGSQNQYLQSIEKQLDAYMQNEDDTDTVEQEYDQEVIEALLETKYDGYDADVDREQVISRKLESDN